MATDYDYDKLMAEVQEKRAEVVGVFQKLLGCCWGREVATEDDREPCLAGAERIVIIHPSDGSETVVRELKLCAKHIARLEQETDSHGS